MRYRVAVIGCGRPSPSEHPNLEGYSIGHTHAAAYLAHPRTELVAVADIVPDHAKAMASRFGVNTVYTDYRLMLRDQRPDIVSVCTWPPQHAEMTIEAARAGVAMVLCEKPMGCGLAEIDAMVATCRAEGTRLYVNHQRRYAQPYRGLRRLIADGALGRLHRLEGWVGDGWDLMSWGTHWVDMHRFLAGDEPVSWVFAQAVRSGRTRYGHPVEDQLLLQFQFESGLLSHIHLGPYLTGYGLAVTGAQGTVLLGEEDVPPVVHSDGQTPASDLRQTYLDYTDAELDGFSGAVGAMISSYEQREPSLIDAVVGQSTTEVVLAAYLSAQRDERVRLPIPDRSFGLREVQAGGP